MAVIAGSATSFAITNSAGTVAEGNGSGKLLRQFTPAGQGRPGPMERCQKSNFGDSLRGVAALELRFNFFERGQIEQGQVKVL